MEDNSKRLTQMEIRVLERMLEKIEYINMKDNILSSLEELKKGMDENNQRMLNLLNRPSLIGKKYHSDDKTDQESDEDSDEDYSNKEIDESKYGDPDEDPFIENDPPDKGEESDGTIYDEPRETIKDKESDTKNEDKGKDEDKL